VAAGGERVKPRALIVEDEQLIRSSLGRAFSSEGHQVETASSVVDALALCSRTRFDLCVLDLKLGGHNGLDVLRRLRADAPETQVIIITAHGSVETAVEAMKLGAFDFVKKPFELDELIATAQIALRTRALERRVAYHDDRERSRLQEAMVVGGSAAMRQLEHEVNMLAAQPVPVVLVNGETGSGKALVARRLHFGSARATGPFVELNAAAIPETLIESELFGHERGAFSDARERKLGLVEVADGGTLFLDEIGDLAPSTQAKLLTFLESLTFRRVGATAPRTVDVRVVAATNRDLLALSKDGRFRSDLYYRLSPFTLRVPPLRERAEDIGALAQHFLGAAALRFRKAFLHLSLPAAELLRRWHWPGNVRELKAVVERAVLMNDGTELLPNHLPAEIVSSGLDPLPASIDLPGAQVPTLEEVELRYMRRVLELTGGNKVRAAALLGITRQTLGKRIGDAEDV
jgi:DNA-binding NtrC family response regulator